MSGLSTANLQAQIRPHSYFMTERLRENVTVEYEDFFIYQFESILIEVRKNDRKGVPYADIRPEF